MFQRRKKNHFFRRTTDALLPQGGWRRRLKYFYKRTIRMKGSPHAIAFGAASGIAVSFTPFYGFHLILTFIFCRIFKSNWLASAVTAQLGNPITFPPVIIMNYYLGSLFLGLEKGVYTPDELFFLIYDTLASSDLGNSEFWNVFWVVALGSIPGVIVSFIVCYYLFKPMVRKYQSVRSAMRAKNKKKHMPHFLHHKRPS